MESSYLGTSKRLWATILYQETDHGFWFVFNTTDQLLLACLFLAISMSILPQVTTGKTLYKVWVTLEKFFSTKSKLRIIQLQNQLRSFWKERLSADDYITCLTAMVEELREAGIAVDDGELSLIALNWLDASYDPFITAKMEQIDDINFASLLGMHRSYESRLNCNTEVRAFATTISIQSINVIVY